jgi:hypothetical protein
MPAAFEGEETVRPDKPAVRFAQNPAELYRRSSVYERIDFSRTLPSRTHEGLTPGDRTPHGWIDMRVDESGFEIRQPAFADLGTQWSTTHQFTGSLLAPALIA